MIPKTKRIAFVGAGNVAVHMATALLQAGFEVPLLVNKHRRRADVLPDHLRSQLTQDMQMLENCVPDLVVIAVGDQNIQEVVNEIGRTTLPLVHTSGAVTSEVLGKATRRFGSFYPLQTMTLNEPVDFGSIPICIHGNSGRFEDELEALASCLSDQVHRINDEDRSWLHLTAVFMNNNINHLLARSQDILRSKQMPVHILQPLLETTIQKAMAHEAKDIQTGPARRNDLITYEIHRKLLKTLGDEDLTELYDFFWKAIQKYYADDVS